jgi:glycosyltransferase involved in cell wall biosynthesis
MRPLRILFNAWADRNDVNAQNLNARDIATRLNPSKFFISLFYQKTPDPRLTNKNNIFLIRVQRRLGSLVMLRHMLGRYDAIFYMRSSRADRMYRWVQLKFRDSKAIIAPIESQLDVLDSTYYAPSVYRFYDEVVRISDRIVANSPYVAQTIKERYGIQASVIYSGVDADYFRRLSSERPYQEKNLRVMFAGSFQERKHPELVLEAARRWPDLEFLLMGSGPMKPLLIDRIVKEKLSNVSIIPTMEYPEYAKLLVTADIFLFPSRIEGLPKVTLEAAASGTPILVFDDYQTPSVINGVTGFQVKTFEEMLDRLRQLIENRDLRLKMGAAAVEHAKKFDWDVIVPQWEEMFEKAITKRSDGE